MWKRISDSLYSTRVVYTRLKKQRDVRATPVVLHLIKLFEYRSLSCYKQRIWSWCFLFQPDRIKVPSYFGASKKISSSHFSMADVSSEKKKKIPDLFYHRSPFSCTSSFFWTTTCCAIQNFVNLFIWFFNIRQSQSFSV